MRKASTKHNLAPAILLACFSLLIYPVFAEDYASKLTQFETAHQLKPDDKAATKDLGLAYIQLKRLNDAKNLFDKLCQSHSGDPECHYMLAEALFRSSKYPEAAIEFKSAYNLDKSKSLYASRTCDSYLAAQKWDDLGEFSKNVSANLNDQSSKSSFEWYQKVAKEHGIHLEPPKRRPKDLG